MLYYNHRKQDNKKADRNSSQLNPIGTNQNKKGSSIITGAKEKDNEENEPQKITGNRKTDERVIFKL